MKILVVEDDALVRATLAQGLAAHGFEVAQAACGREALALVASVKPELALVDVRLPDLSGPELAKILDREHGVPVLFLSAYDDQVAVSQALEAGGLGYLVKPLTVAQLVPALKAAALAHRLSAYKAKKAELEEALASNRVINQAIGVLMERRKMPHHQAFELLRQKARSERRKVYELALQVVQAEEVLNGLGHQAGSD
ncbi:response regulator [Methylothermus subterraneus]